MADGEDEGVLTIDDATYERIQALCAEGDALAEREEYVAAIAKYKAAFVLIPEPWYLHRASDWVLAAIGDALFFLKRYEQAQQVLNDAVTHCPEARANPFFCLRLGQVYFELGDERQAENWLAGAAMLEGKQMFKGEDPKYWQFISSRMEPPPGGW
jgi:tetratricopeptide (TPR) repeat protein